MARSVGLSVGAVGGTLHRARAVGFDTWAAVEAVSDDALEGRLWIAVRGGRLPRDTGSQPDATSAVAGLLPDPSPSTLNSD